MAETLIKGASRRRIQWIRSHYRLETGTRLLRQLESEGVASNASRKERFYRAVSMGTAGRVVATIEGTDKAEVCRLARAQWGHFNFRDEAVAFNEIFPPAYARGQR